MPLVCCAFPVVGTLGDKAAAKEARYEKKYEISLAKKEKFSKKRDKRAVTGGMSRSSQGGSEASKWMRKMSSSLSSKKDLPEGPNRIGLIGISRDKTLLVWARDNDGLEHDVILSERFSSLGRKMAGRSDTPGWDDISDTRAPGGTIRCIGLPVHDLGGATKYVVAFGTGFPVDRAQCLAERLALMLGPLVEQELKTDNRLSPEVSSNFRQLLEREIATANSRAKLDNINNQVEQVRSIMERNVEMILDRGESLKDLEDKSDQLSTTTLAFKAQARKLKRWHLMNQVKWGVAVGTIVTVSVAVPILALAAV